MIFIIIILLQDFLVFPQFNEDLFFRDDWSKQILPPGIRATMLETYDGHKIELWRLDRDNNTKSRGVVLMLHGNVGRLVGGLNFMKAMSGLGFVTYLLDYRGFGYSTGWPSTNKIKKDIYSAVASIASDENVSPQEITPFGISLGAGFAAYAANKYHTLNLVLVSPFANLRDTVASGPIMGWFKLFMWNDLTTLEWIKDLQGTCVVAIHGTSDPLVPYEESLKLQTSYHGSKSYTLISQPGGGHVDAFWSKVQEATQAITHCTDN